MPKVGGRSVCNDFAESSPLLLVLYEPSTRSHDSISDLDNFSEATYSSLYLHEACNRQAHLSSMLEHDEKLDAEGDWLDLECVVLVDLGGDGVRSTRAFQVSYAVLLPLSE